MAGGSLTLQEADQEEQAATLWYDGLKQAKGAEGTQQGETEDSGGISAPLLPAAGQPASFCDFHAAQMVLVLDHTGLWHLLVFYNQFM